MKTLLHTIALEPARWTPRRVSQSLGDLLEPIAEHGFTHLEIYEPHLDDEREWAALAEKMQACGLAPVVLSSYLNLNAAEAFPEKLERLQRMLEAFAFQKIRLFPGPVLLPTDCAGAELFAERLATVAEAWRPVEILLETHDHSLADDPLLLVEMLDKWALPNVGLLYQPTQFLAQPALEQMRLQKHQVRHIHLQNRDAAQGFATLAEGVVPWRDVFAELGRAVPMTLEFVPRGICAEADFDLLAILEEAQAEANFVESLGAAFRER